MRLLIGYCSTEGQTRKIAQYAADHLREHHHEAQVVDCGALQSDFEIDLFDAAIIAASVHQTQHQAEMVDFVTKHKKWLEDKPAVFISVSLSEVFEEDRPEAGLYIEQFLGETGWQPQETLSLAGALQYQEYDFMRRWTMRYMASSKGAPTDTSRNYEFTDWKQLEVFLDGFVQAANEQSRKSA